MKILSGELNVVLARSKRMLDWALFITILKVIMCFYLIYCHCRLIDVFDIKESIRLVPFAIANCVFIIILFSLCYFANRGIEYYKSFVAEFLKKKCSEETGNHLVS